MKSVGPKLVPFFKTCAIFFVLYGNEPAACGIVYCILKCLPVISLILFILLDGMSLSESYYRYSRRILIGLIFSCFGDVFLVWKHKDMNFELGLLMFAVAQTEYARAFGWRPFNLYAGGTFAILGAAVYYFLSSSLDGIMSYLVALYITLICTMAWRAVARVQIFDDFRTWCKLCGSFAAIFCLLSKTTNFELPFGLVLFAVAQIEYAHAFGWKSLNLYVGGLIAVSGSAVYYLLSAYVGDMVSYMYLVALFVTLVCIMGCRAVARFQLLDDLWTTWGKLFGCIGAMFFVLSDLTIAVDKFCFDVPCAHQIIMLTYYAAQVFIALSVVDSQVDELLNSNQKKTDGPIDKLFKRTANYLSQTLHPVHHVHVHREHPVHHVHRE